MPAAESDLPEIVPFLCGVFGMSETYRLYQPAVMHWKCFAPHPFWPGSRAYLLRFRGKIAGYGCVVPMDLLTPEGAVRAAIFIDWAGSRSVPGAGVLIFKGVMELVDALFGIGGSDAARKVIPAMGFAQKYELAHFTRVTRPLARLARNRPWTWKGPLRAGRDLLRLAQPAPRVPKTWSAREVGRFDESVAPVLPAPGDSAIVLRRSPELLNYLLDCPAARMHGFLLYAAGRLAGYCILSQVEGEARIAELWTASGKAADWDAAFALAARLASRLPGACAVRIAATFPAAQSAARRAAWRLSEREPVYLKDPQGKIPAGVPLALGLTANDYAYL